MTFLNKIWDFVGHNKYWIVVFFGVMIVGFTGDNSVLKHWGLLKDIDHLESEIASYNKLYEDGQNTIKQIQTNPHAITKIAREQYYMKADDEDIFVFQNESDIPEESENNEEAQ